MVRSAAAACMRDQAAVSVYVVDLSFLRLKSEVRYQLWPIVLAASVAILFHIHQMGALGHGLLAGPIAVYYDPECSLLWRLTMLKVLSEPMMQE
jgi:predicted ferric reductase